VAMREGEIEFTGANPEVLCYYYDGVLNRYYTLLTLLNANAELNFYEVEVHGI